MKVHRLRQHWYFKSDRNDNIGPYRTRFDAQVAHIRLGHNVELMDYVRAVIYRFEKLCITAARCYPRILSGFVPPTRTLSS